MSTYSDVILADNPVAYWPLDNTDDDSTNTNTLTFTGATAGSGAALIAGDPAASTDFSGNNQFATASDHASLDPGDTFTIEAWINVDGLAQTQAIYSGGTNGIGMLVRTTGNLRMVKQDVAAIVDSTITLSVGVTYHCVWTKSTSTSLVYIDGVDRTGSVSDQEIAGNGNSKRIGANYSSGTSEELDGRIGHVALYSAALSGSQVLAHYNAGVGAVNRSHLMSLLGVS